MEDIRIVNKYKPDYVGFVFADSKRKVSHNHARQLKQNLNSDIISVGVFVDATQNEIVKLFAEGIIDIAQLHGNESEEDIISLKRQTDGELKIIKAVEMSQNTDLLKYNDSKADYLLLDSGKGSGKTFDWRLINSNLKKEFFLAGGLNSSNVCEAISRFNPYAVDLSSGLETDRFKDENKIKELMEVIN